MIPKERPCPCGSGKPFAECHGLDDEPESEMPHTALVVRQFTMADGRLYKIIGTSEVVVNAEAIKMQRWIDRG